MFAGTEPWEAAIRDSYDSVPEAAGYGTLADLIPVFRQVSALAARNADLEAVTGFAAERLGATVWVLGDRLNVIAASAPAVTSSDARELVRGRPPLPGWDQLLETAGATRLPVRVVPSAGVAPLIVAPVFVDGAVAAYLATLDPKSPDQDEDFALLLTEHAATVCGLIMGRELIVAKAAGRARDSLVEGLLLGRTSDPDEIARWAAHVGYEASLTHRVIVIQSEVDPEATATVDRGERQQRMLHAIESYSRSRSPLAVTAVRDDEVVIVAPEDVTGNAPSPDQLATECGAYSAELFTGIRLTIGLSRPCGDPTEIARAYAEAARTVGTAARLGRHGEPVRFEDLGIHRLLLQLPSLDELRAFAVDVLGPIVEYDARHGSNLLETLAAYFHSGGSARRMARQLHIHVNTVSYRLRRIGDVGNLDLEHYSSRLAAEVAVEIINVLGTGER